MWKTKVGIVTKITYECGTGRAVVGLADGREVVMTPREADELVTSPAQRIGAPEVPASAQRIPAPDLDADFFDAILRALD